MSILKEMKSENTNANYCSVLSHIDHVLENPTDYILYGFDGTIITNEIVSKLNEHKSINDRKNLFLKNVQIMIKNMSSPYVINIFANTTIVSLHEVWTIFDSSDDVYTFTMDVVLKFEEGTNHFIDVINFNISNVKNIGQTTFELNGKLNINKLSKEEIVLSVSLNPTYFHNTNKLSLLPKCLHKKIGVTLREDWKPIIL